MSNQSVIERVCCYQVFSSDSDVRKQVFIYGLRSMSRAGTKETAVWTLYNIAVALLRVQGRWGVGLNDL